MSLITFQGVDYGVGGPLLLESVNLAVERNERVCIVGRNGAGKSTLLRLMSGEILPDDGVLKRLRMEARLSRAQEELRTREKQAIVVGPFEQPDVVGRSHSA